MSWAVRREWDEELPPLLHHHHHKLFEAGRSVGATVAARQVVALQAGGLAVGQVSSQLGKQ